jgi:preprotein translocase subunit YajC
MTNALFSIIAQATPPAAPGPSGLLGNPIVMVLAMIVMFYFLLIRPQQVQRKQLQQRMDSLQAGDRVVTSAGIHGLVHNIKDKTVILKIADNTMVEFDKSAVAIVLKKEA